MNKLRKSVLVGVLALPTGLLSVTAFKFATASLPTIADLRSTISTPQTGQASQQRSKPSLTELINETAKKHKIDPRILSAIVRQESAGRRDAIRFEPGQISRAAKLTRNVEQQRMLASSHGLAQIMGWWAPQFGISWVDLYDDRTNLDVACKILRIGLDRHQASPKAQRLHKALAEYNGSDKYAREVMGAIAEEVIQENLTL